MLNITTGKIARAQKVVIYGPEGIGKTTLASQFPNPLFLDTEGGTAHIDVQRVETSTWEELLADIDEVARTPGLCKTLVVDTADWAERMEIDHLCRKNKWSSIETPGYGKGYQYCAEEFGRFLDALDRVIAAGIHVVVTAHAKMRKFEQPDELGAYDRWETKLTKQVAPLLKEWCDMLLFCNYKTFVVQGNSAMDKAKVQGGKRVMYTAHHPCWDAKNRHGLPEELPMDFQSIAHIFGAEAKKTTKSATKSSAKAQKETPPVTSIDKLRAMMTEAGVTEEQVRQVVSSRGHYAEDVPIEEYTEKFLNGWLIRYWTQVLDLIHANQKKEG